MAAASPARFATSSFNVPLSLGLVDGWIVEGDYPGNVDLQRGDQDAGISSIADTTVANIAGGKLPWPDDMVGVARDEAGIHPGAPQQVMVGGLPATRVDVQVNAAGKRIEMVCSQGCWLVDGNFVMSFIEVRKADGTGIVVITEIGANQFDEASKSLDQLMATMQFS